jgi:hypothetical protein
MAGDGSQQRKPDFKTAIEDIKALATVLTREAEDILGRRTAQVLGILVLLVVAVGTLLAFLNWYVAPSGATQKQALVVTLAQILGGTALLSGLYFTWRTLQVNREGQITDRFTRAIDQLGKVDDEGNKLFEIRVGGIYALERIARESEEDYWPIMEILTAYIRQNAPLPEAGQESTEHATDEPPAMEGSGGESETTEPSAPDPDIQAIMTVLRRRKRYYRHEEPEPLDLSDTNLSGARLEGAHLRGTYLLRAQLSQATLWEANLSEAYLIGANLWGAILQEANLSGAHLEGVNFSQANLIGVNFSQATLWGANLKGALLMGANLSGADLLTANLQGADLAGANLIGAASLTQEQLDRAGGDKNTQLSPQRKRPSWWVERPAWQPDELPEED